VETFKAAQSHKGTSFVEVFQNCVIFNDKTFGPVTSRDSKDDQVLVLEEGQPLVFGANKDKGIRLNGLEPEVVTIGDGVTEKDLLIHQPKSSNSAYANLLAQMSYPSFPTPMGVMRQLDGRETYEDALCQQVSLAQSKGDGNLQELLTGRNSWVVED